MTTPTPYSGRYFDGVSTRAIPVEVYVGSGKLTIACPGVWEQAVAWDLHALYDIEQVKTKCIIKQGGLHNLQILEVSETSFIQELQFKNPDLKKIRKQSSPFVYLIASMAALFVLSLVLIYFFAVPWIDEKAAGVFPREAETRMGKTMLENFLKNEKVNAGATALLNDFDAHMKVPTDYPIHITVVNSATKNAFALPGGEIVVYSGMLNSMNTYPELIALLGHETGHIQYRHSLKLMIKNISLVFIVRSFFDGYNDLAGLLASRAAAFQQLSYSREAEEDADRFGYNTMKLNRTDPRGMVALFDHLKQDNDAGNNIPEFLLTHPKIENRIKIIEEKLNGDTGVYIMDQRLNSDWKKIKEINYKQW
jgi:Zn-dependent protease with chaperone function